ncbi:MAG: WalW protein, partial [Pseudomonadota bacterium]
MGDRSSRPAGGYRVPAPEPHSRVEWPVDFGTRFIIFVDTEEEFDWTRPVERESRGVSHMAAMPAAHGYFAAHHVPLNYLVDHPIATSPEAVDVLAQLIQDGRSSIGTQLHPWVNPPFDEDVNAFNSFTGNLPLALQEAKLVALTDAIEKAFGKRPVAYRAGRYGIGPQTLNLLAKHGYRVDTSMRSAYDYSGEAGPDFSAIPNHAFRTGAMIELPLTTVFTGWGRRGGAGLNRAMGRLPASSGVGAFSA